MTTTTVKKGDKGYYAISKGKMLTPEDLTKKEIDKYINSGKIPKSYEERKEVEQKEIEEKSKPEDPELTVKEIKEKLDDLGVKYNAKANKNTLLELLAESMNENEPEDPEAQEDLDALDGEASESDEKADAIESEIAHQAV